MFSFFDIVLYKRGLKEISASVKNVISSEF